MGASDSLSDAETRVRSFASDELRALAHDQAAPIVRLGHYLLLHRLGVGGMAEVFLAKHEREAGGYVVIKRILPSLSSHTRFLDMFRREARVAMRLDHANIVRVYGLIEDKGQVGLVMEYLEGLSLYDLAVRSWDGGRSLPLESLVKMMIDAANALHFAHNLPGDDGSVHTIVHRDVSPDNLLVTKQGITKLLDFGVAKPDDDFNLTRTGQVKGKVSYMSPEQARGEKLDGRSDLFSLGVSFYWLLTGVRPFDRESAVATMEAVILADIPRPSELNPMVPAELELVVLRLLERDRRFRTSSGAELAGQLKQLLARVPADHMSPARLLENVLDMPAAPVEVQWPTHVAVPSVDWASGRDRLLEGPSAPRSLTGDSWARLETRQLPIFGLSQLGLGPPPSSGVFTEATLPATSSAPRLSAAAAEPAEFPDTLERALTLPPDLEHAVEQGDTVKIPTVEPSALRSMTPMGMARLDEPATIPLDKREGTIPSDVDTLDVVDPLSGPITLPGGLSALELPPNSDPDTDPQPIHPPTVDVQPMRISTLPLLPAPPPTMATSERRPRVVVLALIALGSLCSFAGVAWLVLSQEQESAPVVERAPPAPPVVAEEPAAPPPVVEPPAPPPSAVEPPAPSPPVETAAPPTIVVEEGADRKPAKPKREGKVVELRGPPHVAWKSGSKQLGRGTRKVTLDDNVDGVSGFDGRRNVKLKVPLEGGVADWDAQLTEELVVRVRPWAKVWLGDEELGLTPLKPVRVVPGRYVLKLEWEKKVREQDVRVRRGAGQTVVNIDMRVDE